MDRRAIFPKGFAGYYLQISISVVLIFSQRFAVLWKHRLLEFSYLCSCCLTVPGNFLLCLFKDDYSSILIEHC